METRGFKISWATLFFYLLVLIVLFFGIRHFADVERAALYLEELSPFWLLASLVFQSATYFCVASLFNTLARFYGHLKISQWELFRSAIVIVFLDQAIPTGGVSGNSFIYSRLRRSGMPAGQSFSVLVLKSFTYYLSHFLILLTGLIVYLDFFRRDTGVAVPAIVLTGVLVYALLLTVIAVFGEPKSLARLRHVLVRWRLGGLLTRFGFTDHGIQPHDWHGPVHLIRDHASVLLRVLAWQVGVILADVATIFAIFAGLGHPVPFGIVMICFSLTMVVSLLSITPGALAFFEVAMVYFFTSFGSDAHIAVIATLAYRALSFWLPMPIGLALYRQLTRPRQGSADGG